MGGTVTSQHPGKVTPVLRGRPGLLEVEEEEGAGTARATAVEQRATTDTAVLERPAVTIPGLVVDTVEPELEEEEEEEEDTPAVATPVTATGPRPLLATPPALGRVTVGPRDTATTPPPATPRPRPPAGQLAARASPDLAPGEAQSDPPPGIPEQTPTAETNNSIVLNTLPVLPVYCTVVASAFLLSSMLKSLCWITFCCFIC